MSSSTSTLAALLAQLFLDASHIDVLFLHLPRHYQQNSLVAKSDFPKAYFSLKIDDDYENFEQDGDLMSVVDGVDETSTTPYLNTHFSRLAEQHKQGVEDQHALVI